MWLFFGVRNNNFKLITCNDENIIPSYTQKMRIELVSYAYTSSYTRLFTIMCTNPASEKLYKVQDCYTFQCIKRSNE